MTDGDAPEKKTPKKKSDFSEAEEREKGWRTKRLTFFSRKKRDPRLFPQKEKEKENASKGGKSPKGKNTHGGPSSLCTPNCSKLD